MPDEHHSTPLDEPSEWVMRFALLVPAGSAVLDVACGSGRHSLVFLDRGHAVTAVDRDVSQLKLPRETPRLTVVEADLEDGGPWPLGDAGFGGVVATNYLHRALFPALIAALEPGGVLIYETFAEGHERFGRPRNPDHLLKPGELLEAVRGHLRVVAYEDTERPSPKPAMIQRICAVCPGPER